MITGRSVHELAELVSHHGGIEPVKPHVGVCCEIGQNVDEPVLFSVCPTERPGVTSLFQHQMMLGG